MRHREIAESAVERCKRYRRRILEVSQRVTVHVAGAFSCIEIIDDIYHNRMKEGDTFILSKGHAGIAQYVVLEDQGKVNLDEYCKGPIGCHPDLHVPGVACATGSLGHGLGMAAGIAYADPDHVVYVLLSDGEIQEGSTWEVLQVANALHLDNLHIDIDNNRQNSSQDTRPFIGMHLHERLMHFGWLYPRIKVHWTVKGHPFPEMAEPIWHYKSPSPELYEKWMAQLA